ncbi:hypothetical protein V6N11_014335 [Hibiscus sabdariffa]|uniref:Uncharacterized protein n=2 Tax=Hibiscus sabdariffa TaxID=183260 RepID=A0ABR1ZD43_9ROSI
MRGVIGFLDFLSVNGCGQTYLTCPPPRVLRIGLFDLSLHAGFCGNADVALYSSRRGEQERILSLVAIFLLRRLEKHFVLLWILVINVNVDVAVSTVDGSAGIGVVFQDNEGRWLFGFARFVGRCPVLLAELWAIHDRLAQAWTRGHRCVELESDNLEAVRSVNSTSNLIHEQGLVLAIKRWLRHDWRVRVKHVPRGQNRVADKLAAKGRWLDYMPIFLATVPDDVVDLVTEERERSSTERVRSENLPGFPYDPGGDSGNRF